MKYLKCLAITITTGDTMKRMADLIRKEEKSNENLG